MLCWKALWELKCIVAQTNRDLIMEPGHSAHRADATVSVASEISLDQSDRDAANLTILRPPEGFLFVQSTFQRRVGWVRAGECNESIDPAPRYARPDDEKDLAVDSSVLQILQRILKDPLIGSCMPGTEQEDLEEQAPFFLHMLEEIGDGVWLLVRFDPRSCKPIHSLN